MPVYEPNKTGERGLWTDRMLGSNSRTTDQKILQGCRQHILNCNEKTFYQLFIHRGNFRLHSHDDRVMRFIEPQVDRLQAGLAITSLFCPCVQHENQDYNELSPSSKGSTSYVVIALVLASNQATN